MNYIGRFAPSPTGPLHFGSLLAALASYCDARAAGGKWLLRMEDIDPPRAMPGAADLILRQLEVYGFTWDGEVLFQHQRTEAYRAALEKLQQQGDIFWCRCSRTDLARFGSQRYPGICQAFTTPRADSAIRLRVPSGNIRFHDAVFGRQEENVAAQVGDFILRRRDGLFSYQLAVAVDDAFQNISHVVRGADLLNNTARQMVLQNKLGFSTPCYAHLPLAEYADGRKLSKQTHALALPLTPVSPVLLHALRALGQTPPHELADAPADTILTWAVASWRLDQVPATPVIIADQQASSTGQPLSRRNI